jgi:glycosyltransferase involved in cell wall biosynthesis
MSGKILFNALQALPTAAGVGRYALEAARGVSRLRDDVTVLLQDGMQRSFDLPADRLLPIRPLRGSLRRILFEQVSLPAVAREFRLVHFPDSACSLRPKAPYLMTVHDLSFFACTGTFTAAQTLWKRGAARLSAKRAERIVCSSRHTAGDVRRWLGVPEKRIRVVYPGVTVHTGDPAPPDVPCPDGPFVLGVGTLEPRKNFVRLFQAVARLRGEGLRLNVVIAGKKGWLCRELLRAPRDLGIEDAVTFAGFCSDRQLKWLYQRACLLAYVSLYEGFGFPPLEAMALGLPVVASNVSSLPEVCGDAALYVDPTSVADIGRAIRKTCDDVALRERLAAAGPARSRMFTWQSTATKLSDLYDEMGRP